MLRPLHVQKLLNQLFPITQHLLQEKVVLCIQLLFTLKHLAFCDYWENCPC
jgi:hypothetical protein